MKIHGFHASFIKMQIGKVEEHPGQIGLLGALPEDEEEFDQAIKWATKKLMKEKKAHLVREFQMSQDFSDLHFDKRCMKSMNFQRYFPRV